MRNQGQRYSSGAFFLSFTLASFSILTLGSSTSFAAAGTSGGNILSIPIGARAIGMGEAYTAQADDVSSLYWNPAGMAILNQSQASFMYNESYQGMSYQNASIATPLESGGVGASISYMNFGNIAGYDVKDTPTGNVNAYSGVGTIGGGVLAGPLSLGLNLKGVQAKLDNASANGVAVDGGAIWTLQREILDGGTLRAGATVRNLGTGLTFVDQQDPFPTELRLGVAAVQLMDKHLNLSMDYGKERDVNGAFYAGGEYWLGHTLALRAGYAGDSREGNGLRAGIGIKINDFSLDYAYAGYGDLGMSHRYEISWRFGEVMPRLSAEERRLYRRAKLAMAEGRYNEANLLFDSLIHLEPAYKPFQRWSIAALKKYSPDAEDRIAGPMLLHSKSPDDMDQDQKELSELLSLSEGTNVAQQKVSPAMGQ